MGKKLFIILFAIVTMVMLSTGLVYSILMTLVTNKSIQLIAATIYDIGYKWFNIEFNAVTVLFIISILILIVIHMIITKIIYVILREIGKTCEIGRANMTYDGGYNTNFNSNVDNKVIDRRSDAEKNYIEKIHHPDNFDSLGNRKLGKWW